MDSFVGKDVYITEFALTRGIIKDKITRHKPGESFCQVSTMPYAGFFLGKNAFLSELDAKAQANILKDKKLKSLKKKILKLEKLDF
jgi:hypothetical protein